ncbi:MAG: ABC transporter ATP-binding protein, partial [Planctomycetota bacterium]
LGMGLSALLSKGVAQVSKGIAAFAVALIVDARLTIITLLVAPIMYHVIRRLGKKIRRASRAALARQADLYAATSEALQGLRVVRASNAERFEMGRFHCINKDVFRKLMSMRTARAISSPTTEAIAIVVLAVLALIAVKAVNDGELDPTDMVITLAALGISGASLRPLTGIVSDIQQSTGAAQRIEELLRLEQEPGRDRGLPKLPRHARSIAFENVSLTYPGADEPAISGLSLEVPFGQTIAVVGPNGSGKTSLLSLIPRLFDPDGGGDGEGGGGNENPGGAPGRVLIDGVDIASVSARSLRDQIGVVSQETVLFKGTIAENIAYAARPGTVTHEAVIAAAKGARAHDFITEKGGYDTPVGERGLTLSGGQRQRIAIARAILRNPAILLLDEATSMIDSDSEARINEALREFALGRTCLVVAHRLSTVLSADTIAVLDRGRLIDHGTHAELMDRCETYRVLAERQLSPAT